MIGFEKTIDCMTCSRESPVFCFLKKEEIANIDKIRFEIEYKPGETILKSGTPTTHVMSFYKGLAKISLEGKHGNNFILNFIRPPAFFSGPGLFIDNIHHFTITAVEPCKVCLIEMDVFLEIMKRNAEMTLAFMKNTNKFILSISKKMEGLLIKYHHGRIAEVLLYLSRELYKSNPFKMSISRKDLSELTGVSKENISRILHEFSKEGLICFSGNTFELLKEEVLEQISLNG